MSSKVLETNTSCVSRKEAVIRMDDRHGDGGNDLPASLAKPAQRALAGAGITRLDGLTHRTEAEIAALHGRGPKALGQLRDALARRGLAFASETQAS